MGQWFLMLVLGSGLSWGGGIAYQDRTRQEAEYRATHGCA